MDKIETIEQLVEQLKAGGEPARRRRRRWKSKPKPSGNVYTPSRAASQKAFWATPSGQWKHLCKTYRSRAKARGEESRWKISLDDWIRLWNAGAHQQQDGFWISYLSLRGKSRDCAKLWRIDVEKDWTLDNVVVLYKGQVVINGRKLCQQQTGS